MGNTQALPEATPSCDTVAEPTGSKNDNDDDDKLSDKMGNQGPLTSHSGFRYAGDDVSSSGQMGHTVPQQSSPAHQVPSHASKVASWTSTSNAEQPFPKKALTLVDIESVFSDDTDESSLRNFLSSIYHHATVRATLPVIYVARNLHNPNHVYIAKSRYPGLYLSVVPYYATLKEGMKGAGMKPLGDVLEAFVHDSQLVKVTVLSAFPDHCPALPFIASKPGCQLILAGCSAERVAALSTTWLAVQARYPNVRLMTLVEYTKDYIYSSSGLQPVLVDGLHSTLNVQTEAGDGQQQIGQSSAAMKQWSNTRDSRGQTAGDTVVASASGFSGVTPAADIPPVNRTQTAGGLGPGHVNVANKTSALNQRAAPSRSGTPSCRSGLEPGESSSAAISSGPRTEKAANYTDPNREHGAASQWGACSSPSGLLLPARVSSSRSVVGPNAASCSQGASQASVKMGWMKGRVKALHAQQSGSTAEFECWYSEGGDLVGKTATVVCSKGPVRKLSLNCGDMVWFTVQVVPSQPGTNRYQANNVQVHGNPCSDAYRQRSLGRCRGTVAHVRGTEGSYCWRISPDLLYMLGFSLQSDIPCAITPGQEIDVGGRAEFTLNFSLSGQPNQRYWASDLVWLDRPLSTKGKSPYAHNASSDITFYGSYKGQVIVAHPRHSSPQVHIRCLDQRITGGRNPLNAIYHSLSELEITSTMILTGTLPVQFSLVRVGSRLQSVGLEPWSSMDDSLEGKLSGRDTFYVNVGTFNGRVIATALEESKGSIQVSNGESLEFINGNLVNFSLQCTADGYRPEIQDMHGSIRAALQT